MSAPTRLYVCNLRFGTMVDESGKSAPLDWAHLHFLEEASSTDGFCGSKIGKMNVDASNQNALSKKFHVQYGSYFPGFFDVELSVSIKGGIAVASATSITPVLE